MRPAFDLFSKQSDRVFGHYEVEAFFASGAYEENFMGVVFDPEEMVARFEKGEALGEITKRRRLYEGETPWSMDTTGNG